MLKKRPHYLQPIYLDQLQIPIHLSDKLRLPFYIKPEFYTIIYVQSDCLDYIEKSLTEDLNSLTIWFRENELILNLKKGKTEVMLFGTKQRLAKQDHAIDIKYNSKSINVTSTYKYLGVILDQSLNMEGHFKSVCKKISSRLRMLKRVRPFLTDTAAQRIYEAMIMPIATYCSLTNYYHQNSRKNIFNTFDNRAQRIIKGNKTVSIINACKIKTCIFVHKALYDHYHHFQEYFELISHGIETRNNKKAIRIPVIKLQSTKKAFFYNGAITYNNLPLEMRNEYDLHKFIKNLKKL